MPGSNISVSIVGVAGSSGTADVLINGQY